MGTTAGRTWMLLLCLAAAGIAVLLVVGPGGGGGEPAPQDDVERADGPAADVEADFPAVPALASPLAAEPPTQGIDPTTGAPAQADVRFVFADGTPAGRVRASYAPVGSEDPALVGTADDQGRLRLHADVVGRRLLLDVAAGPRWGAERFDLWAVGSTPLVLSPGCQVWLVLAPEDADLVGRFCAFRVDDVEHRVEIRSARTRLGVFRGSVLRVNEVGGVPAARMLPWVLPPTGSMDVPWTGEVRVRVRFQAPSGTAEVPQVHLSSEGASLLPLAPTAQGADWLEFLVPTGSRYVYMAACGTHWALGRLVPSISEAPLVLPATWERGCRLEALLPDPGEVLWARAYVVSEPAREVAGADGAATEDHARILQDPQSSWIDLGAERAGPEHRRWPVEPDVTRSRIVWRCVPRGRVLRVLVAGTKHGTLSQDVTIPAASESLFVSLQRTTSFTVEISGARTSQPGAEEWLSVSATGEPGCTCTVYLPPGQQRVVVRGFPLGETARLSVQGGGVRGEAQARVNGEMVVPLRLEAIPSATYRVRVVDPGGAALPGVGVNFISGEDGHSEVRTDADGVAAAEREAAVTVRAEVSDPRYGSTLVWAEPEQVTVLEALPLHTLRIEFEVGERTVRVAAGRPAVGVPARPEMPHDGTLHVVPGSVLTLRRGVGAVAVAVRGEDGHVLLERTVELTGPGPTTLRVTR